MTDSENLKTNDTPVKTYAAPTAVRLGDAATAHGFDCITGSDAPSLCNTGGYAQACATGNGTYGAGACANGENAGNCVNTGSTAGRRCHTGSGV